ncbi:MAG TPA: hypothetical protein VMP03_15565 [Methylomirabilota bacterium]|nr:hypothetical protein [Methylomirabilota bacterium]
MIADVLKRTAFILLVGAALSACAGMGTVVDENDPESELPNLSLGRSLMEGLGAVPSRRSTINYTPRAQLVVPKDTAALTPPEDPASVTARADWPLDPDIESARLLREAEARAAARDDRGDLIPADELLAQRSPPSRRIQGDLSPSGKPIPSRELAGTMPIGGGATSLYDSSGQPVRRALVEPPVTYLEPAPGVPVAIPEEKSESGGLFSWLPSW